VQVMSANLATKARFVSILRAQAGPSGACHHVHPDTLGERVMPWTQRRALLRAAGAVAASASLPAAAASLLATPPQTTGPFYPQALPLDDDNDLVMIEGRPDRAAGTILHLAGRVLDSDGRPVPGVRVEIWQCDAFGVYHHARDRHGPADANFQGFGHTNVDDQGGYRFRTIEPVPYPGRTPHMPEEMDVEDNMVVNVGPHHPATHGVLRLAVELDGETVRRVSPEVGYLHSGFEKTGENKRYEKFIPYCDRMDYAAPMSNNLAYVMVVEKLMAVDIPEYAQLARVILCELQRIASHMIWLGTHCMDVSGTPHALAMYCFVMRERILDIFEMVCGARMTTSYFSVGGLRWVLPGAFEAAVQSFLADFVEALQDFETMLTNNPIWLSRLKGIGVLKADEAIGLGITGPILRAAGIPLDLRKLYPYSGYDQFEFDVPTATEADCYARYQVRIEELRQSMRIVEQGLKKLKPGPFRTADRKVALPPRHEISTSMESLIHHFKLVTEGYRPPVGQIYGVAENPKGWLGFGLISDGTAIPHRLRVRGPSFVNLQATHTMAKDGFMSDLIAIIGSIDIVLGEVDR
jgi:NADH dehydrogenase I D subunit